MADEIQTKREAALRVMDMLESCLPPLLREAKANLEKANEKLRQFTEKHSAEQSSGCLPEALGAVFQALRYVVCVYVLRMDREFVSLNMPGRRTAAKKITGLPEDSPILCSHRALDGLIAMLPSMRAAIEESDVAMTAFHGVISRMAVSGGDFWPGIFGAAEATGVPLLYAQEDFRKGFPSRGAGRLMVHFYLQEALRGYPIPAENWKRWGEPLP